MTKRMRKRGPQDTDRLVLILERAVKGETFEAIGKSLDPPLTRERVRQLLKTLNVTSTDFVRVRCDNCGDPLHNRGTTTDRKTRDGKHYCSKPECNRLGSAMRKRAASPTAQLPRAVCASCGDTMKHPVKRPDGIAFCMKKKECRAARMRHYYATSEYHRQYAKAVTRKHLESGKQREYQRRYQAKFPNTTCAKCGVDTGRKHAKLCDTCRGVKRRPAGYILGPRPLPEKPTGPHPSILQFRALVHDPNFARLHALHLLKVDGMSERAVAEYTGISRSALNGWSLGVRLPKLRTYFND